jgi:hypothetical protein
MLLCEKAQRWILFPNWSGSKKRDFPFRFVSAAALGW